MTSILAAQPLTFSTKNITTQMNTTAMLPNPNPILQSRSNGEIDEKSRGRRRSRIAPKDNMEGDEMPSHGETFEAHSSGDEGPSRKRRRSRKGLDKKFECPAEGCGKSYSRAEHLYRHQLNHTPKQIFNCDFEGCMRTFVRQDLCNRHKDRHTAKGSQLHRKDSMLSQGSSVAPILVRGSQSPEVMRPSLASGKLRTTQIQYQPQEARPTSYSPTTNASSGTYSGTSTNGADGFAQASTYKRSDIDTTPRAHNSSSATPGSRAQRTTSFGTSDSKPLDYTRPTIQTNAGPYGLSGQNHRSNQVGSPQTYISQQNFPPFSLPPPGFATVTANTPSRDHESPFQTPVTMDYQNDSSHTQPLGSDLMLLDQMAASNTMPVFGGEGSYNRSPFTIPEDFVNFLFSQQNETTSQMGAMNQQAYPNYPDAAAQYYAPYFANDIGLGGFYPPSLHQSHHPMAVTSLLDTSLPETVLSDDKSQQIVDLIKERFNETGNAPVAKQKDALLEGDRSVDSHMMSRKMMQTYISSYWYHFNDQMPILHKPTFSPDKTPNLLLIAMMAIGASCLDKMHGYEVTQAGAELSNFLAWHLRWEIFSDNQFRPPAKLWVFQALLLLELYEKMYSTRALHERAHIHHATTITLMRRGSSLIGRSALDSPPSVRDDKQGNNGSRQSSTSSANTPSEWWNHWITNEATRRAAFAAFVIDSTHATMFGHSTVMVAHEMRLPLPCDESLWTATSSAEVGRLENNLGNSGLKPLSFMEGLKRTLNGQEVRTNSFGRTVLMAGLLSVSWHMNQRDLQISSLGVLHAIGGRDKWRLALTKAYDFWKADFDKSLKRQEDTGAFAYNGKESQVVFESRTVLHHLAHMAMHVDVVDCQIFARAKRLLGRTIGSQDLNSAQRRMKESWAPSAKARDATFYALKFLRNVLFPHDESNNHNNQSTAPYNDTTFEYSARDDVLLNRPWVMYFAALIVWCYGYALEGPTNLPIPSAHSFDDQVIDMRMYLRKFGSVESPENLKNMHGFNECTGMLMVLRTVFKKTRWELLHEAALLLSNAIELVSGQPRQEAG